MTRYLVALAVSVFSLLPTASFGQQEGPIPTQSLVAIDSKTPRIPTVKDLSLKMNNRDTPLASVTAIPASGSQIAILIDDGLRNSVGRQLSDLRNFVTHLPNGTEIFIGYMQNGRVVPAQDFTTDYAAAAKALRIPLGTPGASASPYFCLSDFAKKWPASSDNAPTAKARFALMITNGVDPYNGGVEITNQNSIYVDTAIRDAQRASVAVYSIYYTNAGTGGSEASFSGQSYLSQVAEGTGGRAYFQGTGNPVSMAPFLKQFQHAIAETFIATFDAPGNKDLVPIKFSTRLPSTKVRAARQVRPGARIISLP